MARQLLSSDDAVLERNARKVKLHCRDELQHAASAGQIDVQATSQGSKLLAILLQVSDNLLGDTQDVEGINSMIRIIGNRCPRIDLCHLSPPGSC